MRQGLHLISETAAPYRFVFLENVQQVSYDLMILYLFSFSCRTPTKHPRDRVSTQFFNLFRFALLCLVVIWYTQAYIPPGRP